MYMQKVKHVNIELKVIKLDLERIAVRLEDTNRSIKDILIDEAIESRAEDLKEYINFNRFLLQKHKEKIADKQQMENRLKSILQEENKREFKMIEDEKRLDYLLLTLDNNLEFNNEHPFYTDSSFISDLISELLKREDYEKCALLKKHIDSLKESVA